MKSLFFKFSAVLFCLIVCGIIRVGLCAAAVQSEQFKEPPSRYSVAPFWFLNGDLKKEEIIAQLTQMYEKGVEIVIPHARTGLVQRYLGNEWFSMYSQILETVKQLGMRVIIYDEYNWISGKAGYEVPRENRIKHLSYSTRYLEGPNVFSVPYSTNIVPYLFLENNKIDDASSFLNIKGRMRNHDIYWNIPEGRWRALVFRKREGDAVDLLSPEGTSRFLSLTHEEYYVRFKQYFGNTVIGFCFDEPIVSSWPDFPLPWNDAIADDFMRRYGYSLIESLPALFFDTPHAPRVRSDFYSLVAGKTKTNFFSALARWAKNHGDIFYCGHLMNDDDPYGIIQTTGGIFSSFAHIPGFDWGADHLLSAATGRVIASIGELHSPPQRISCEIFGGNGWAFSTRKMKQYTDWAFLLGANMIIPHAFYYSVDDIIQRSDYPPSLFMPQPYWETFKPFADYIKRSSYIFSNTQRISPIAFLYPLNAMKEFYTPLRKTENADSLNRRFVGFCDRLFNDKIDFQVISEYDLSHAVYRSGKLRIGNAEFSALVIFSENGADKRTKDLIAQLTRDQFPVFHLEGENDGEELINRIAGINKEFQNAFKVSEGLFSACYRTGEETFFFIANQSQNAWGEIELLLPGLKYSLWDPLSGEVYSVMNSSRILVPPLYS
ncbi:MAG: hypothetical protein KKC84_06400, partial [Candidatus Omnitrophica bacterium]|nr:hypothetical protein [Candidatus Omnitrophota bacterium]